MERPWGQGTKEGLWPIVSEKLRPSGQHLTWNSVLPTTTDLSLEVAPSSVESSNQTAALAYCLITDCKWPKGSGRTLGHTPLQESEAHCRLEDWSNFPGNPREAAHQSPWGILGSAQLTCQRRGAYFKVSPSAMDPYSLHTTSHSQMYTSSHDWILTCRSWDNKCLLS